MKGRESVGLGSDMKRELWNRCDICGRFISFSDIENGLAVRELDTPDTHFTPEAYETLCREHGRFHRHDYGISRPANSATASGSS